MRVPSLYTPPLPALYAGEEALLWYEYRRTRDGVRDVRLEHEVHGGDVEGALRRIVERAKPRHPYVLFHVDPRSVLTRLVPVPQLEEDELAQWQEAQIKSLLPQGYAPGDLAVSTTFVGGAVVDTEFDEPEPGRRLLISITERKAIEESVSLLETVGLNTAALYSLAPIVGYALLHEEAFAQEQVVVRWERGFDVRYAAGHLQDVRFAPQPAEPAQFIVEEPRAEHFPAGTGEAHASSDSLFAVTRAMALAHRFGGLTQADFLGDEEQEHTAASLDGLGARRVIAIAAAFLLVVFGSLGAYYVWASQAQEKAREAVEARVPDLKALEREEAALRAAGASREAEIRFARTKSRAAAWMDAAARAVPTGMRLTSFSAATDSLGAARGTIRGEARTEVLVEGYVERLRAERLGAELRYVLRGREQAVIAFEIALSSSVEARP